MINATHKCQYPSCKREPTSSCYFCQQEAYQSPYVQHNSSMMNDVGLLIDRMNTLADSMITISITSMRGTLCNQLQQWRDDSIGLIHKIYKQKQVELNTKIVHLDAVISQIKVEKQQEITQIRLKVNELVNVGGPTSEQMIRLRKLIDQIAIELDKLRSTTIRIDAQPVNTDTCRIIFMDPILNVQSESVTASVSKTRLSDDVRHFSKPTHHSRPTTTKPMPTTKSSKTATVTPSTDSVPTSHTFHNSGPPPTSQTQYSMPPHVSEPPLRPKTPHISEPPLRPKTPHICEPPHRPKTPHICEPPLRPKTPHIFETSHRPKTPHISEPLHRPKTPHVHETCNSLEECSSPAPSDSLESPPRSRSPDIPMPPPIYEPSYIPMPPPVNKSPPASTTNNIPMPPPIPKPSNIPMPPPVTTSSSVPLRTIKRYGKHQVMFE